MSGSSPNKRMKSGETEFTELDGLCVDTIRCLAADIVQKANSGHPGAPMSLAPVAHVLWTKIMTYDSQCPEWTNRDRFVLSNGHACALLYSMLHLTGYNVTMEDLQSFRQIDSKTAGHPETTLCPGVEVCTGPLGQGISQAVGLAVAESHLGAVYNRGQESDEIISNYTYVICGDGCLQEGVSSEASSLAGHLGLGKLIVLYDDNNITIDGETDLSFTEDVAKRYEAYNWHVSEVTDGNDLDAIYTAIQEAKKITDKPSIIKVKTIIGYGSAKQGSHSVHGAPLGADDISNVKKKFGFNPEQHFNIPSDVSDYYLSIASKLSSNHTAWQKKYQAYKNKYPELASELERRIAYELPSNYADVLPRYSPGDKAMATRKFSEIALNSLASILPELVGGSADLTPSNLTSLKCSGDYQKHTPAGRYMRFGVREHGMTAIANGMMAYGGMRPFVATFLNFIGYAMGAVRLSSLSHFGTLFIMTHDSIGLGEDGPTHQPIEILEMCRSLPNLITIRPCDGNEVSGAYALAMQNPFTPTVIALSRQNVPNLNGTSIEKTMLGAYTIVENQSPDVILVSTGTEVSICVEAAATLSQAGTMVNVVSFPSWEIFERQPKEYQLSVFPSGVPVLSVEASATHGWSKYSHASIGLNWFGASGPYQQLYQKYGFTPANIASKATGLVNFYKGKTCTSKIDVFEASSGNASQEITSMRGH